MPNVLNMYSELNANFMIAIKPAYIKHRTNSETM